MKTLIALTSLPLIVACGEPGDGGHNEQEVISRVELTFTPQSGSTPLTFTFDDPDGDGGAAGTAETVTLTPGNYGLSIAFLNGLETPPEDITAEVRDEGTEHQVFLTGNGIRSAATNNSTGPLLCNYADTDANGMVLGLEHMCDASAGTAELVVTLRHMPPELPPEKELDTALQVATGGFAAIGGSTDAQVTFPVTVP